MDGLDEGLDFRMGYFLLKLKRAGLQFLFLLFCYSFSRLIFVLVNHQHFVGLGIGAYLRVAFMALRFDVSAIAIINLLYWVLFFLPVPLQGYKRWERFTQWMFIVPNAVALLFEISDWAYFPFALKRSTADVLDMITRKGDFLLLLPHFLIDFWYVPLAAIVMVILLIWVNRGICSATPLQQTPEPHSNMYRLGQLTALLVICGLSVVGVRGGITNLMPIGVRDAAFIGNANYVPVVLNTPFSIANTLYAYKLPAENYMPQQEAENFVKPIKRYHHKVFRKMNVVVIILESFSKEFTRLGKSKSYTPFLDSLMSQSYTCVNAYANGVHSAEAIPAVLAGVPTLMEEPFTTSTYGTNKITTLPNLLKDEGYTSAFYHGGTNGTMCFDMFCANAGFDDYYGRNEYNNEADYDGNWGIWDEPFLQYFVKGISTMPEPFLATVFTLSSHDPYSVPEQYKTQLPPANLPVESTIFYSDMALRKFFQSASKKPWYKNTLFVLTADHPAMMQEDEYYSANMGRYAIPILFYAPGDAHLKGVFSPAVQQADIMPSVLDYLGYSHSFFALGNSIFEKDAPHFSLNEFQGQSQLYMDGFLLQTIGVDPKGLYTFPTDSACMHNQLDVSPASVAYYTHYLKAFKQVYSAAMINNKMWVNKD